MIYKFKFQLNDNFGKNYLQTFKLLFAKVFT